MHGYGVFKPIDRKHRKYRPKVVAQHQCRVAFTTSHAQRAHDAAIRRLHHSAQTAPALQHGRLYQLHAAIGHSGIGKFHRTRRRNQRPHGRNERAVRRTFHQDATRGHARLTSIHGHRMPDGLCSDRHIRISKYQCAVAAREFQRAWGERSRADLGDLLPHCGGSGEHHVIKLFGFQNGAAGVAGCFSGSDHLHRQTHIAHRLTR